MNILHFYVFLIILYFIIYTFDDVRNLFMLLNPATLLPIIFSLDECNAGKCMLLKVDERNGGKSMLFKVDELFDNETVQTAL